MKWYRLIVVMINVKQFVLFLNHAYLFWHEYANCVYKLMTMLYPPSLSGSCVCPNTDDDRGARRVCESVASCGSWGSPAHPILPGVHPVSPHCNASGPESRCSSPKTLMEENRRIDLPPSNSRTPHPSHPPGPLCRPPQTLMATGRVLLCS